MSEERSDEELANYQLRQLATYMAREFYPEVPQWRPLDDTLGLISQIDNMVTGLTRADRVRTDFLDMSGEQVDEELRSRGFDPDEAANSMRKVIDFALKSPPQPYPPQSQKGNEMINPDDIAQDIWDEAYRWAEDGGTIYRNIARAILNERNNAAEMAEALLSDRHTSSRNPTYVIKEIVQAIRNGGK